MVVGTLGAGLGSARAASAQLVSEYGVSLDLASAFVWRGQGLSDQPNIQPGVWVVLGDVEVGAWGSYAFDGSFTEQDAWVTYTLPETPVGSFAFTVNDYYENTDFDMYFDFDGVVPCAPEDGVGNPPECAGGGHTVEIVGAFAASAIPLELSASFNVYNDPDAAAYVEAIYAPSIAGFDLGFTAGAVLGASNWYYEIDQGGFYNLAAAISRTVEVGDFSVPFRVEAIHNPKWETTHYVAAVGVSWAR